MKFPIQYPSHIFPSPTLPPFPRLLIFPLYSLSPPQSRATPYSSSRLRFLLSMCSSLSLLSHLPPPPISSFSIIFSSFLSFYLNISPLCCLRRLPFLPPLTFPYSTLPPLPYLILPYPSLPQPCNPHPHPHLPPTHPSLAKHSVTSGFVNLRFLSQNIFSLILLADVMCYLLNETVTPGGYMTHVSRA